MLSENKTIKFLINYRLQILWAIAVILIAYFLFYSVNHISNPSNGFASYYTASKLIMEGENPSDFYNDEYFSNKVKNYVPGIYEIYLVNLPTTGLLLLPLAYFDYSTARVFWISCNLILLAVTMFFIVKRMQIKIELLPFVLVLIFSFQPLYSNVAHAQAYILIFCLLVFSFLGIRAGKNFMPGFLVGITFITKSAGIFLILLFIILKKWKSLAWAGITIIILTVITFPVLGYNSWMVYADRLMNYSSDPSLSVTAYQSIFSFFHHLFIFNKEWNPNPILDLPIIGYSVTLMFSLCILLMTVFNTIKYKNTELAFASFISAGLILNPTSIDYHYVLILIPILILIDWLMKNQSRIIWLTFILSFLLIALSIPYLSPKVSDGFLALLAYPKLYGAVGLWYLSLVAAKTSKSESLEKNVKQLHYIPH